MCVCACIDMSIDLLPGIGSSSYGDWVLQSAIWKMENQENWWCRFQSESEDLQTKRACVMRPRLRAGSRKTNVQLKLWGTFFLFPVLAKPSMDWMVPTHREKGHLLYSVTDSNANLLQKHPHECLTKYLGTPLAQSSWYITSTIQIIQGCLENKLQKPGWKHN